MDKHPTPPIWTLTAMAALALCASAAALAGESPAPASAVSVPQTHGEGTLLLAPQGGHDREVTRLVEPGLASMVFANEAFARELVAEADSLGERLCLADLGPQQPQFHGQRWWVFSC